jgi:SnoaL-like polyketide cyclase
MPNTWLITGSSRGPKEVGRTVEIYAAAFPDMQRELYQIHSSGDIGVVQLALQGTHLGPLSLPFGTIPPTGKKMDAPRCDVFEMRSKSASLSRNGGAWVSWRSIPREDLSVPRVLRIVHDILRDSQCQGEP